jgi:hypothetical protein
MNKALPVNEGADMQFLSIELLKFCNSELQTAAIIS